MKQNIQTILQELYAIDPGLKKHEDKLRQLVESLLLVKPDTKFDKRFAKQLRAQLLSQATEPTSRVAPLNLNFNELFMKKISYALGGAILAGLIIVPTILTVTDTSPLQLIRGQQTVNPGLSINRLSANAFGELTNVQTATTLNAADASTPVNAPSAEATSVSPEFARAISSVAPVGMGGGGDAKIGMIYPITQYKYVYNGDALELEGDTMPVLRRKLEALQSINLAKLGSNFNMGLLNLNSFGGLKVNNIALQQGGDNGYQIMLSFFDGTVSLYRNYNYSQPMPVDIQPRTPEQIPADEVVIGIANNFVAKHKINLDSYGEPRVNNEWRVYYEQAVDKSQFYVPESVTVVYPLEIDGQMVLNRDGSPDGLYVAVNYLKNQVDSVNNLMVNHYDSSEYAIVKDINVLLEKLNGQQNYPYPADVQVQTLEVELGTPELVLTKSWHYDGVRSQELLVPALKFPVTKKPADAPYYQNYVVIPIAEQILENEYPQYWLMEGRGGAVDVQPMPASTEPAPATDPAVLY